MKEKLKTLVVVPAYNEALNIEKTVHDLQTNAPDVDYVIINDGSRDNTLEVLQKNNFNYVDGFLNQGLFGAVQTGFKYALENGYDVAIQFDGDGQHSAAYIKDLVDEIENGSNIAIGSRFVTEKKPWTARMAGSRLIAAFIRMMTGAQIKDPTSGFRAYDKECIKDYALSANMPPEPDTLVYMLRKGKKIQEVQVEMSEREFGESYLNLPNTIKYMTRMLVSIVLIQPFRKV
mgnify:FL=1